MPDFMFNPDVILPIALVVGSLALIFLVAVFHSRYQKKKLEELAGKLGGKVVSGFLRQGYCSFDAGGYEGRITLIPAGKHSPAIFRIALITPASLELIISKENWATKKLSKIGFMKDVKTSIPEFDDKYLLKAKNETQTVNLFQDANRRQAVEDIFRQGFQNIKIDQAETYAEKPNYKKVDLEQALIKEVTANLSTIIN